MKTKQIITAVALAATTLGTLAATPSFADARHDRLTAQRNFWKGHAMNRARVIRAQRANIAAITADLAASNASLAIANTDLAAARAEKAALEASLNGINPAIVPYYNAILVGGITTSEQHAFESFVLGLNPVGQTRIAIATLARLNSDIDSMAATIATHVSTIADLNDAIARVNAVSSVGSGTANADDRQDALNAYNAGRTSFADATHSNNAITVFNRDATADQTAYVSFEWTGSAGATIAGQIDTIIEDIREASYNEGYDDGYTDGYTSGYADGVNDTKAALN